MEMTQSEWEDKTYTRLAQCLLLFIQTCIARMLCVRIVVENRNKTIKILTTKWIRHLLLLLLRGSQYVGKQANKSTMKYIVRNATCTLAFPPIRKVREAALIRSSPQRTIPSCLFKDVLKCSSLSPISPIYVSMLHNFHQQTSNLYCFLRLKTKSLLTIVPQLFSSNAPWKFFLLYS